MHPLARRCGSQLESVSFHILRAGPWPGHRPTFFGTIYPASLARHAQHRLYYSASQRLKRSRRARQDDDGAERAAAIVVGGGPAGMAVVGNFLESIQGGRIVWIDKSFEGGNINQFYRECPSYSPVSDYIRYARSLQVFREICEAAPQPNALTALEDLNPEMTCRLSYTGDMLHMISGGLRKQPRVKEVVGTATRAVRDPKTGKWTVTVELPEIGHTPGCVMYRAPLVVFCTGVRGRTAELPLPLSQLAVEKALSPSHLAKLLPADEPRVVAVVGSGHSAVLTLRNLFRLAAVSHRRLRIRWFTRTPHFTYAEQHGGSGVDAGAVLHEHDGLTGEAALFARRQLDGDALASSDAGAFITRFVLPSPPGRPKPRVREWDAERQAIERAAMLEHLDGVDHIIQCIGFERRRLPEVRPGLDPLNAPIARPNRLVFNAVLGSMFPHGAPRDSVIGLFGAGSAFPELDLTPFGYRQPAVGVWKFMKFVQRMAPRWVAAAQRGRFAPADTREQASDNSIYHEYY